MMTHYQKDSTTAVCGIRCAAPFNTTNPELVTCKRCLARMASMNIPAATEEPAAEPAPVHRFRPFAVVMDEQTDRVDAVLAKPAKEPKPAKPAKGSKPATVHLHDSERSEYGTWCRIPGQHTTDPELVTCKVCRAHIDGKAPLNVVPERVKQARKTFRSFVARVAYMVFMDRDCGGDNGINWSLSHTNMAGDCYEIGRSNTTGYRMMCNASIVTTDLGQDIKEWMEEHWSCGEDR